MDEDEKMAQLVRETWESVVEIPSFADEEKLFDMDGKCEQHRLKYFMMVQRVTNNLYNYVPTNSDPDTNQMEVVD